MIRNQQYNASRMRSMACIAATIQKEDGEWLTPDEKQNLREVEILLQTFASYLSHVDPAGYLDRLQELMQLNLATIRDTAARRRGKEN